MKPRARKCKINAEGCELSYVPFNSLQPIKSCRNPKCAHEAGKQLLQKQADVKHKADKERIKPRNDWVQDAEKAVRFYVRMRDAKSNYPCISCGRHEHEFKHDPRGGLWDAGHYLGKGAFPELRMNTDNIHRQCKQCNRDKSGNTGHYRPRLIERIGLELVEWLEGPHVAAKLTIDELREIKVKYNGLANQIKKELQ
jgi:hypothetical protein